MRRHTHRHACFSKGTHQPELRITRGKLAPKMSLACTTLASFLLIFIVSNKGTVSQITEVVWGIVDQDINLDIPELSKHDNVDHIRWQKNENKIAEFKKNKETHPVKDTYMMLPNGTLRIKDLKRDDEGIYKVTVYATDGKHMLERKFDLQILDGVSKPVISWSCANKTVTCEVAEGSDPKLKLYVNKSTAREGRQKVILWKWNTKWSTLFKCVASNNASEQISMVTISCTGQGLDIYLIIGICGGGTVFLIFIALLIFYTSKRKKQSSRRNDEELEIRAKRASPEERGRKPHPFPGSTPQNPVISQTPPMPGHRSQAPTPRPGPPGPRVQHPQKKRPPPTPGTQVHQQKGPPLPKPRVQTKPTHEAKENS
uniref:T-cell surface antigen CD2 n=3 Tax=Sus scrofa TaxID=9823 RepID=K7GSI1_PIG